MAKSDDRSRVSMRLPSASATEASVLGSCLIEPSYWALVESMDDDAVSLFYEPDHMRIATVMHRLHRAGHAINDNAIVDAIRASGDELEGGTREFLVEMALHSSSRDQAEFATLIKILGEQRALRKIAMTAATISERACESGASPSELAEQLLGAAEFGRTNTEPLKRLGEHVDEMDQAVTSEIPTGLKCIDRVIGGWQSGRLYAIAARPKVGKTAITINSAIHALAEGAVVVMISLEMSRRELWGRLLACTAFVPLEDVMAFLNKKRTLDDFVPEQRESLEQAIADLKAAPLYVAEASDLRGGITDVMATIVDVRSRYGADQKFVVFVDYLQLLVRDAHHTVEEVTNYTRELKLMAGRMDIPVIALSQINRGGEDGVMPLPSHMRGSGSIGQDADVTILLNRRHLADNDHPESDMEIWVALSRYSATGRVRAHFYAAEQALSDVAEGAGYDHTDDARSTSRPSGASTRGVDVDKDDDMSRRAALVAAAEAEYGEI